MGILELAKNKMKELRGQSHMPHPTRRGPPVIETTQDIACADGKWGISGPETWEINKRLEMPFGTKPGVDASVEALVDFEILPQEMKQLTATITTGFRNRVKGFAKRMLGD